MKKKKLLAVAMLSLLFTGAAQAAWWDKVAKWVKDTAKDTGDAVTNAVNYVEDWTGNAIDWVEGAVYTVGDFTINSAETIGIWYEGIAEVTAETGYTASGSVPYVPATSPMPDSGTLVVGTYNMTGTPEALGGITDAQARQISADLESWNWDIGTIQEDFVVHKQLLSHLTQETYPSRSRHYNGDRALSFGDGLLTVSGFNSFAEEIYREPFTTCLGDLWDLVTGEVKNPDCDADKGFTVAEVRLGTDMTIHVYNTHLSTGGRAESFEPQLAQISNSIQTRSKGYPVIVTGDFNMNYGDNDERLALEAFLSQHDLTPNCYLNYQFIDEATCKGSLDHIMFRGNSLWDFSLIHESPRYDDIARTTVLEGKGSHFPRQVTLKWQRKAYTNWANKEPNDWGSGEDCVMMYKGNGQWNDSRCTSERQYACKDTAGNWVASSASGEWNGGAAACSALGLSFSAPVSDADNQALQTVAATYVAGDIWINGNDLDAEDDWRFGASNLALAGYASQISTGWNGPASNAIDGNTDGNHANGSGTGPTSHTGTDQNAWWQVDLKKMAYINNLHIHNRTDTVNTANRLQNFWVLVSGQPFSGENLDTNLNNASWKYFHEGTLNGSSVEITAGTYGRYVKIMQTTQNFLHLAEVEVYGHYSENLALSGTATQISTGWNGPASNAIDGNTNGVHNGGSGAGTGTGPTSHTGTNIDAWWQLDLNGSVFMDRVDIHNRTDTVNTANRLQNFWVLVSDQPFSGNNLDDALNNASWSHFHVGTLVGSSVSIPAGVRGRYLRIQQTTQNYLHLAEVQVFGTR